MPVKYIKSFKDYQPLMWEFVRNTIKLKYKNSVLGILWSILEPLLITAVLTFVFSNLFKNRIPYFPVYCLTGRLLFSFFSQTTNQCMKSITSRSNLIKKIYVPKYIYPLSTCIANFIIFGISMLPLLGLILLTGVPIYKTIFLVAYPLGCLFFISFGVGLALAAINVFFRDIEHLYSVVLLVIMYMSAIFYSADIIPADKRFVLHCNPVYSVITVFRDIVLNGFTRFSEGWLICGAHAVFYFAIGLIVFYKTQDRFILYI